MANRQLSVVIPIFSEEATLSELFDRLTTTLHSTGLPYEIVFVDDGSSDKSGYLLRQMRDKDRRVKIVTLSRNFGHQAALSAGLDFATGDAVVMMDGDLQDPPELLPLLIREWLNGAEVVLTVKTRRHEPWLRSMAFWGFYRLVRFLADVDLPVGAGIFSLMDRCVVEALKQLPERSRYLVGLRSWVGFRRVIVPYERPHRPYGRSRVGMAGLVYLALDAIFSFSVVPLRLITVLGFLVSLGSFLTGVIIVFLRLFTAEVEIPGWASIIVAGMLLGGVQLMVLGILGEYVGRIFEEAKGRPLYVVKDVSDETTHSDLPPQS